ncbi:MAG: hypothetical protein LBT00_06640 [Spirochaetaceae bacterium]|jgi:hypothetical protein|nr:hypothetical protein [Spirochaetaceae bacterium]
MKGKLRAGLVILAVLFVSCQTTQGGSNAETTQAVSDSGDLSSLLRAASVEVQKWDKGNERERDVTVYSFNYDNPELKDRLIQAVKDAGFYQVWSGENTRDWDLQRGVLRWCVPADTEQWDREVQVSAVGETTVHTYFFKPIPDSGVYWTAVEDSPFSSGSDDRISDIAYGDGKFVAVGIYKDGSNWKGEMAYSVDGVTWTKVTDSKLGYAQPVTYGGGKFVSGGEGGKMAYSTDGVTWTAVADSKFGNREYITRLFYVGGKFFAHGGGVGNGKEKTAYSTDGVTWTVLEDSALNFEINGLSYGGGRFVAVGAVDSGHVGKMAYSTDGVTWTRAADNEFSRSGKLKAIVYGGDKFVVGGWDYGARKVKIAYSIDGITWTVVEDNPLGSNDLNVITYVGGRFVVGGEGGRIAYSNMQE